MDKTLKDEVISPLNSIVKLLHEQKECIEMLRYRVRLNDPKYPTYALHLKNTKINEKISILEEVMGSVRWKYITKYAFSQYKKNKFDLTGDIIGPYKVLRKVTREEEKKIEALNVPWHKFNSKRKEGGSLYNKKQRSSRWEVRDLRTGEVKIMTKAYLKRCYMDKDLRGFVSGKLRVIGGPEIKDSKKQWLCKCICGREVWKPDRAIRTKVSKICCRWCTSSKKAQDRAHIIFERQVKKLALKDKWFDREYKRLQSKPKELKMYEDKLCAEKAIKLLEKEKNK